MYQLKPQDAQFLYMESEHNLTHVTSLSIYDPSTVPGGKVVRFKDIMAHVQERLQYNPLFYRKLLRLPLEIDYPYWVEDEYFDLEYHIRHGRLPEPGDWRQLCIHLSRYHSRPLDMKRPPWEMFVIEGLDHIDGLPRGCYALATKIHHSAVDGTSLMQFFATLADSDNLGTPAVPLVTQDIGSGERPALKELLVRAAANNVRYPLRMAETLMRTAPGLYRMAQGAMRDEQRESHPVPHTRFNADVSPHKMFDARTFPLDDLRAIRKLVPGATINDVVLAICSGTLRRYLQHHKELPQESLIAWVPINARPKAEEGAAEAGNRISAMTAPIHTNEPDALERLRLIYHATRSSKEARSGVSARLMTDLTQQVPAATQVMAARLVMSTGIAAKSCNLFISNVPGPQEPLYMNGALLVGSYGLAPLGDGMGLFIGTPSYNGKISFNVISTRELLPDIEFFMQCMEEAKAELRALVATLPAEPAAAAPLEALKARAAKVARKPSATPRSAGRKRTAAKAKAAAKKSTARKKVAPRKKAGAGKKASRR